MSLSVSTDKAWDSVATVLRRSLTRQQFETWFRGMRIVRLDEQRAEFTVPNNFLREWIRKKYLGLLRSAMHEVVGGHPEIDIRVAAETYAPAPPAEPAPVPHGEDPAALRSDIILNRQYTFDTFVAGPSNNLAHAAAMAVAETPGKSYNPLFLHGAVGLGKTHLLQAVCHRILDRRPEMRILYLSCETFTNHFVAAVAHGELESFRYRYRHVDLLLIDDIHLLANKDRTQEEFFHTFNTLYNANKQIVLSSDSTPAEIPTLEERLVSRFKWGMVARIDQPGYETRTAIISRKVEGHGIPFPDEVIRFLGENIRSNIRELEGVVNKIAGMAHIYKRPVDMETAREAIRDLLPSRPNRVSIDGIIRTVSDHYAVRISDLHSKKRTKSIAFPRQICMYLARCLTSHSLEEIGGYFGGRDHTTVMYAFDKIRRQAKKEPALTQTLERLTAEISS